MKLVLFFFLKKTILNKKENRRARGGSSGCHNSNSGLLVDTPDNAGVLPKPDSLPQSPSKRQFTDLRVNRRSWPVAESRANTKQSSPSWHGSRLHDGKHSMTTPSQRPKRQLSTVWKQLRGGNVQVFCYALSEGVLPLLLLGCIYNFTRKEKWKYLHQHSGPSWTTSSSSSSSLDTKTWVLVKFL